MVQKNKAEIIRTETLTQQGECKVYIDIHLDINVNNDGTISTKVSTAPVEEPQADWAIPDFSVSPKLKFGKEIK